MFYNIAGYKGKESGGAFSIYVNSSVVYFVPSDIMFSNSCICTEIDNNYTYED